MVIWIDGSNLRGGGGISHLVQLLENADPLLDGFSRIEVWANERTLRMLPERPWLEKRTNGLVGGRLAQRILWQQVVLPRSIKGSDCDVLFSPGATIPLRISTPTVTMFQNSLPFSPRDVADYAPLSRAGLRLRFLREVQRRSINRADGVIFLSKFALDLGRRWFRPQNYTEIPHGVDTRFRWPPRPATHHTQYSSESPFRFLYVSHVDLYKHQWTVAEAFGLLRREGLPVALEFVGPLGNRKAMRLLNRAMADWDPSGEYLTYTGPVPFSELHLKYRTADAFVFASSCENLPNTLIEAMSAGLPIASSEDGPMPEVLADAGVYFDPRSAASIAAAVRGLVTNDTIRSALAMRSFERASRYGWRACAKSTFEFLGHIARNRQQAQGRSSDE